MPSKPETVIVGAGAVGISLFSALPKHGYPIAGIVSRSPERLPVLIGNASQSRPLQPDDALPSSTRLVFLCVPDDAISATASRLAKNPAGWSNRTVTHTSGALTSDVLSPLANLGAQIMSFHPMQTFSKNEPTPWHDIYVGIEGGEKAVHLGEQIARDLGAHPIRLNKADKPTYHAAASIASNMLVVLADMSCNLLESIGIDRQDAIGLLGPLIRQTAQNATVDMPEKALTGPAARGDLNTLRFHFETLATHFPSYLDLYHAMTVEAVDIAEKSGRLTPNRAIQIKKALQELSKKRD